MLRSHVLCDAIGAKERCNQDPGSSPDWSVVGSLSKVSDAVVIFMAA